MSTHSTKNNTTRAGATRTAPPSNGAASKRGNKRPPLGPNARKNLGVFAVLTMAHTLATVIFSAALASAIARAAHAGFAALAAEHERRKHTSTPEEYRALIEFAGDSQAKLDGTLGWLLGGGDGITITLIISGVLALLARAGFEYLLTLSAQKAASGAKSSIRRQLLQRVLATGGADTPEGTGATAVLISRGLDALDNYYTKTLTAFVSSAAVPATLWVVLLLLDPISAITVACTLPLIPLFMVLIGKTTREDTAAAQSELHRLSDHILELVRGLPVLIGLGRERAQTRALAAIGEKYRARTMHTLRSAFMSSLALELITTISVALVAVLIGVRLVNGQMGLDTAILVLLLAPECYQPLRDVGAAYHQSEDGVAALRAAQNIIDAPQPAGTTHEAPHSNEQNGKGLAVENLTVAYPGRGTVLSNLSFTLPGSQERGGAGTILGITGPSGCGKSTLLGVLSGAVREGLVPTGASEPVHVGGAVDGVGHTLMIAQSPQFAAPTVLLEMALYAFSASKSEQEYAAQLLAADTECAPSDTVLLTGYLAELGLETLAEQAPESLSAGQARRLAIARTLARADALYRAASADEHHRDEASARQQPRLSVLVDEPTAHLDVHAAHLVTRALAALAARGANVLIVTHEGELAEHCALWLRAEAYHGGGYRWALKTNSAPAPIPASAPPAQAHTPETTTKAALPSSPAEPGTAPGVLATLTTLRGLTKIGVLKAAGPVMMAAATSLAAVALTALSGWLIVRAAEGPAMMYLMVAIVGVRFFGLGRATARYAERLLTHSRVLAAANTLRLRAWAGAYRNIGSVRALLRGDALLERLIGGIDELRDGIPRVILPPAAHLLVMAVALVSTWVILPQALAPVALAAFVTTVLAPWVVLRADARAEGASRASTAQLMRLSTSLLGAAEDARANGVSQTAVAAAARVDARNLRALTRGAYAQGAGLALAVVAWFGAALWCAVIAYPLAVSGTVGAPESAIVVLMCTGMIESTVGHLEAVRSWPAFARLVARIAPDVAAEAYIPDLTDDEEAASRVHSPVPAPASGRGPALELVNAAARWPGMETPVFEGLTVSARAGEWTGVTGPSGSGKSTVLASLLGFLPLESGQIRAHGQALDAERVRGYAAWCPQAAHIFESTLEGNLLLARDRSQRPTQQQMVAVLRRVGLGQWYDTLPEGLRTRVGAGGGFLSGGQRQRLAVARALLVESPVLLLDEPTAHLDAESAAALMADLDTATRAGGAATVLVSHRPEDIARCDTVVTLE